MMKSGRLAIALLLSCAVPSVFGAVTLYDQLNHDDVSPFSPLGRLIARNQDISLVAGEADYEQGLPPWVRIYWRKTHPRSPESQRDQLRGYPPALREFYEWARHNQDLKAVPSYFTGQPLKLAGTVGAIAATTGLSNSESDVRINPANPQLILAASNSSDQLQKRQVEIYTADGGANWATTAIPLVGNDVYQSDPSVGWNSKGQAWTTCVAHQEAPDSQWRIRGYRSDDGGANWVFDGTASGSCGSSDKAMMTIDQLSDNVYVTFNDNGVGFVGVRDAKTQRWRAPLQVSGAETYGFALGGDITTNVDGNVFVFWPTTAAAPSETTNGVYFRKSADAAVSFDPVVRIGSTLGGGRINIPSFDYGALIYVSAGAYKNGNADVIYATWMDYEAIVCNAYRPITAMPGCVTRIWFTRSRDGGKTWDQQQPIPPDDVEPGDQFNQRLAVDPVSGIVGLVYHYSPGKNRTESRVLFRYSTDKGNSWSSGSPISPNATNESLAGAFYEKYGDYDGLAVHDGKFVATWTDRSIAPNEQIWVKLKNCVVSPPSTVTATAGPHSAEITWSAVPDATVKYVVLRTTTSGSGYARVTEPPPGNYQFIDTITQPGTYFYVVRAVGICESEDSAEVQVTIAP